MALDDKTQVLIDNAEFEHLVRVKGHDVLHGYSEEHFILPPGRTLAGVEVDRKCFDNLFANRVDVGPCVRIILNDGTSYNAKSCGYEETVFEVAGEHYSIPLNRVDIGKMLGYTRRQIVGERIVPIHRMMMGERGEVFFDRRSANDGYRLRRAS